MCRHIRFKGAARIGALTAVCLLALCILTSELLAQTYTLGYARYTRGDFVGAVDAFKKTLAKKRPANQEERAQLYKYMGISQFMLGEKREAARSFRLGLRLNPQLSIDSKEVLDESVIPFFQRIAKRLQNTKSEEQKAEPEAKSSNSATVVIQSNAEGAEVFIDGNVVGQANRPFEAKAGVTEVELRAKGYESRQVRLVIKPQQKHRFEIQLKRQGGSSMARRTDRRNPMEGNSASNRPPRLVLPQEKEIDTKAITDGASRPSPEKKAAPVPLPVPVPKTEPSDGSSSLAANSQSAETKVGSEFSLISLLPFGAGQFKNGQYFLGAVFALSELSLIGLYVQAVQEEDLVRRQAIEFIEREKVEGNFSVDELEDFRLRANKIIKDEQKKQQLYSTSFGVLWLTGIIHAIITAPSGQSPALQQAANPSYQLSPVRENSREARFSLVPMSQGLSLQVSFKF